MPVVVVVDEPFMLLLPSLHPPIVILYIMFDAAFIRSEISLRFVRTHRQTFWTRSVISGETIWGEVTTVTAVEDDGVAAVIAVDSPCVRFHNSTI